MNNEFLFPRQQLPFNRKTKSWRKSCVNAGADKNITSYSPIRTSMMHKGINYQLLDGKLHMKDLELIVNPNHQNASFIPDKIQHYSIMNSKLNVLRGEESKRVFDFHVVVTNPNAISEIETDKRNELVASLQQALAMNIQSEDEYMAQMEKINEYYTYEWQDIREIRANALLNHYIKEYNIQNLFNKGFTDAMCVGEEIYQCDIVSGEPVIEKLNPCNVHVYQSGYSNRVEDADMIVIEEYWSPGRVYDTFYDVLTKKDCEYIEKLAAGNYYESEENEDYRIGLIPADVVEDQNVEPTITDLFPADNDISAVMPFDLTGNIRVSKVYWKSRRRIKKVKSYNPVTGEEEYNLYPETYTPNRDKGEEVEDFWINEAWEGTRIGDKIYVNMRPRPIQYNRLSNPSKCHFGIVGTIYNINNDKPYSLVDMMKPFNYLYDVIHDRLNKLIARNYGKCIEFDFAKIPNDWDPDKWLYFLRTNGIAVKDSFKEGNKGASLGKLAGGMNNASSGVVDLELGQSIQSQIQLLEYIKEEMSEVAGISKQREGQISNRETVGGVERATLQSSHITEWLFITHDDTKKRVLECFLETAKIALRGKNKKFQYILSDLSSHVADIDGDEFAEADYGLIVDNSDGLQKLNSQIETLAQAALQTQAISFSTMLKIYGSSSLAEKQRLIANDEKALKEQAAQQQQAELQAQQEAAQMQQQTEMAKMQQEDMLNQRDNDTKILIATINAQNKDVSVEMPEDKSMSEGERAKLDEQIREFDKKHELDRQRLEFDKNKADKDAELKLKQINKKPTSSK